MLGLFGKLSLLKEQSNNRNYTCAVIGQTNEFTGYGHLIKTTTHVSICKMSAMQTMALNLKNWDKTRSQLENAERATAWRCVDFGVLVHSPMSSYPEGAHRHLPCSLCSSHGCWSVHWLGKASTAPGGNTGSPAGPHSGSSHKARGSACTTDPRPAGTWGKGRGLSPGLSPHSPWGSSSTFAPAQKRGNTSSEANHRFDLSVSLLLCFMIVWKRSHRCSTNTRTCKKHTYTLSTPPAASFDQRKRSLSCYLWLHVSSSGTHSHKKALQRGTDCARAMPHEGDTQNDIFALHTHLLCLDTKHNLDGAFKYAQQWKRKSVLSTRVSNTAQKVGKHWIHMCLLQQWMIPD